MKDIFNIVKVSDIDDIDCNKIVKKCFEKPNMINYYYPHIFMNRNTINKEELIKIFDEYIIDVKRDKNIEFTIRKYNTLTSILESLFLCVLDIDTVKNIQKFIQYNFSKDTNNITEIVNHIIDNKTLFNLDQLLNDKIDNSHSVFIIEKIIEHVKKTYKNDNFEKQTLTQSKILNLIQTYISKLKYNPYIIKIINYNKIDLIKNYIENCIINETHDEYIGNIVDTYIDIKNSCYDIVDNCNWSLYFNKVKNSLNIENQKQKILKAILRCNILTTILNAYNEKVDKNQICMFNINSVIDANKLDDLITNCYINMLKNNCNSEKLANLEVIIKYFTNFGTITKELIKLIIPKYFSKENTKYYLDIVNRLNILTNKKLSVIDSILDEQKRFADDLKITHVDNASKSIFNKDIISLYNIDHKHVEENTSKITKYVQDLTGYEKFTNKWFNNHFSGLKQIKINEQLSNGKLQIDNTIINTNILLLNALFLFNNPYSAVSYQLLSEHFDKEILDDIINTLEYYNLIINNTQNFILNMATFKIKQELKVELIKKVEIKEEDVKMVETNCVAEMIECYILKTIKPTKIHKDSIYDLVCMKSKKKVDKELFDKSMNRLFEMDYYTVVDDHLVYVP
jgi:hypothetical protein